MNTESWPYCYIGEQLYRYRWDREVYYIRLHNRRELSKSFEQQQNN